MGSVPWQIVLLVGVLAFLGALGGAWGAQVISARNEARRWRLERDREAQAFWRDKRLEVYSVVLGTSDEVMQGLSATAGLLFRRRDRDTLPTDMEHLTQELGLLSIIGSERAMELTLDLRSQALMTYLHIGPEDGKDQVVNDLAELRRIQEELRKQVREDLGLSPLGAFAHLEPSPRRLSLHRRRPADPSSPQQ